MATIRINADVAGSVWKILVRGGQKLAAGDTLMILESMKMEIPVIAEGGGTVAQLHVAEGEPVKEGQLVATLSD